MAKGLNSKKIVVVRQIKYRGIPVWIASEQGKLVWARPRCARAQAQQDLGKIFPRSSLMFLGSTEAAARRSVKSWPLSSLEMRGTAFQRAVWRELLRCPAGKTITYQELAAAIGRPKAYRAVANACGQNRIAPFIPCHRAVRQDGSLGGYRWGAAIKRELLKQEQIR